VLDFLKNKSVILVGPAAYLQGKSLGKWIDGFDVVVRINYSILNTNYADYGDRTDVIYNYLADDPHGKVNVADDRIINATIKNKVKYVVTTFSKSYELNAYKRKIKNKVKHIVLDRKYFDTISKKVNKAPNTGTVAIDHLLGSKAKSINVVGFDYYDGKHCKDYLNKKGNNDNVHDNFSQLMFIDYLASNNSRLILDDRLKTVIAKNKAKISIVIPFKSSDKHRNSLLDFSINRYNNIIPQAEIVIGENEEDEWIKSKAVNSAVKLAKGEIIIIVDCDVIVRKSDLMRLICRASGERYSCLHGDKLDLSKEATMDILAAKIQIIDGNLDKSMKWGKGIFCMKKELFVRCGGFNERFKGWGGEEIAFHKTLEIYYGKPLGVNGNLYHLWHEPQGSKEDYRNNENNSNRKLFEQYKTARTIKDLEDINKMARIKTFYHKNDNLGDVLTPIILTGITGHKTKYIKPKEKGKLLAIGSILHNKLQENDIVWGSGSIEEKPIKLPKGVKIYALRGKLTRDLIVNNKDIPKVYGDPALLMPKFYNPKVEKKYKLGLLPHFTDYWFIQGRYFGKGKVINILGDPREVISKMLECEKIVTSSMHGVILCEAYGIPVVWTKLIDPIYRDLKGGEFKFRDYFSNTERKFESVTWEDGVEIGNQLDSKVHDLERLMKSFDKMWKENKGNLLV
jgi:pyruvyltransferase